MSPISAAARPYPVLPPSQRPTLDRSPFAIVRDVRLPRGTLCDQVDAVRACYKRLTGLILEYYEAMQVLDRILADRRGAGLADLLNPAPIPTRYAPIAHFLEQERYDADAIRFAIRSIDRNGTARGTGILDLQDVDVVQTILDQID